MPWMSLCVPFPYKLVLRWRLNHMTTLRLTNKHSSSPTWSMITTEPGSQIHKSRPWGHALGGDLATNLFFPLLSGHQEGSSFLWHRLPAHHAASPQAHSHEMGWNFQNHDSGYACLLFKWVIQMFDYSNVKLTHETGLSSPARKLVLEKHSL